MSDRYNDSDLMDEEAFDPPAAPSPVLQEFREIYAEPGVVPAASEWADEVTTRINDYNQRRALADANAAAGQQFVADIDGFKSGLVSMVQNDPFALSLALDLVPTTVGMLGGASDLTGHMQSEIAAAAVTAAAEQDEGTARAFLDQPRIRDLLGENAGALDSYISIQAQARAADTAAEVADLGRRQALRADRSAINYLGALHNPVTGEIRFPQGWNQAVMADLTLPPPAKVAVSGIYQRLHAEGDALVSNPYLVRDVAARIAEGAPPSVASVAMEAGRGLTLADTMLLLGGSGPVSLGMRREFGQLASTLNAAREMLAPPENGVAGERAFERFTNWLLPTYRARGPGSLDPMSENAILAGGEIQAFAPTMSDIADGIVIEPLASMARPAAGRPALKDIFNAESGRLGSREPNPPKIPRGYEVAPNGDIQPIYVPSDPNRAPFYGVEAPLPSQRIRGGAQNIVAGDPGPTEMLTDTGMRQLTPTDLRQSSSGPRPGPAPALTEEQQTGILEGRPLTRAGGSPGGRTPAIPTRPTKSPRRRR
jgi:hypothetical protein